MSSALQDNQVRLTLEDRLDASTRQQLQTLIADGLARGYTDFVLDLQAIHSIDCGGLGTLSTCCRLVWQHGGRLTLTRVSRHIYELLALTRLIHCFETLWISERDLEGARA